MMAKRQQDDDYKKYLAWLSYVYPRFAKYYDILKADGNWMKPTKKVNETGNSTKQSLQIYFKGNITHSES